MKNLLVNLFALLWHKVHPPFVPDELDDLEAKLISWPQEQLPLTNHFGPGVYAREVLMKAGLFIIGQRHKTEHLNIVLTGKARVYMLGRFHNIEAPCVFKSPAGTRKALYIIEDMRLITIHPTNETDIVKLENQLCSKTPTFIEWEKKHHREHLSVGL